MGVNTTERVYPGEFSCPECGYRMDATTGLGDASTPSPGDVSICLSCTAVSRFASVTGVPVLRALTTPEVVEVLSGPGVQRALSALRAVKRRVE